MAKQCKVCNGSFNHFQLQTGYCDTCRYGSEDLRVSGHNANWVVNYTGWRFWVSWVGLAATMWLISTEPDDFYGLLTIFPLFLLAWFTRFHWVRNPLPRFIEKIAYVLGVIVVLMAGTVTTLSLRAGFDTEFAISSGIGMVLLAICVASLFVLPFQILCLPDPAIESNALVGKEVTP